MGAASVEAKLNLRAGEWVVVRSRQEILRTLDKDGRLEGLPFMPEMFEACGQRFRVYKRAHKTCDPPSGLHGRRMPGAVHLEGFRCNGSAHGGCQARCLVFWKEAWLKRIDAGNPADQPSVPPAEEGSGAQPLCSEADVVAGTRRRDANDTPDSPTYVCQATQVYEATLPLSRWDVRQYLEDYTSGNATLRQMLASLLFFVSEQLASAGVGLGTPVRWVYDAIQKVRGGTPYPVRYGRIRPGMPTPSARLDLKKGELVRVRSYREILETLDENLYNRGMSFDAEMVPYCGRTFRVLDRVGQIINEKTGKMMRLRKDCIMLEGVVCTASYAKYRKFCPRSIYPYWREIWLERVGTASASDSRTAEEEAR